MAASIVALNAVSLASFGLTAETGILVESFGKNVSSAKVEKQDNDGDTVLVSYYDKRAVFTVGGVVIGSTGVAAAAVAAAITLANSGIGAGGVTTGNIHVDSVDFNGTNTDFVSMSVTATQYPAIV
jgi:hypothetical protein